MENQDEEWMIIQSYPDYFISTYGNIENWRTGKYLKHQVDVNGYSTVRLHKDKKGKTMRVHKLVAEAFLQKVEGKLYVDHIDRNRTNCNLSNLRWASLSENGINKSKQSNNTSGIVGVCFDKSRNKWKAWLNVEGNAINLGRFDRKEDAINSRKEAEITYFGQFRPSSV